MAWGARSGLKRSNSCAQETMSLWLNGLGSPFGIETCIMCAPSATIAISLPDTFNERGKCQASAGGKRGQEVLEKRHKKKGTRPFKEEKPSSLEKEEFHERLQSSIEPLARTSQ